MVDVAVPLEYNFSPSFFSFQRDPVRFDSDSMNHHDNNDVVCFRHLEYLLNQA